MRPEPAAVAASAGSVRPGPALAGLAVAALLALFVAWPLLALLLRGVGRLGELTAGRPLAALLDSLALAGASTAATVTLGAALAYGVARGGLPGAGVVSGLCRLPAIVPSFLPALALALLFGEGGLVQHAVGARIDVSGFGGLVIAQVFAFLPSAFLVMADAFGATDAALEEAAESLGASPATVLRRVTLAVVAPALASAALGVFVLSLSDFDNPFLLGGGFPVLTTELYSRAAGGVETGGAAVLAVALLAPCVGAWALARYGLGLGLFPPSRWQRVGGPRRRMGGGARAVLLAVAVVAAGGILGLYGGVVLGSVVRLSGGVPRVSVDHYRSLVSPAGAPILDSLGLAAAAGACGTLLALATAALVARQRPPGAAALAAGSLLPAALPGIVLGLGYLLVFGAPAGGAGAAGLLVAAVVFWRLPLGVVTAVRFLERLNPALEEAARSLGAGRLRTLARVTLPSLAPGALAVFADFFVDGLAAVGVVVLLAPPRFTPGAPASLMRARDGELGLACALATLLGVLALAAALLRRRTAGGVS